MTDFYHQLLSFFQRWDQSLSSASQLPVGQDHPAAESELNAICRQLIHEGQHHRKPEWAAHMTAPVSASSIAGQVLAAVHHGNLLSAEIYPLLTQIEQQLLGWLCQQFYQRYGHFTHGSTYANLEALWQARECSDAKSRLVYGSHAVHYSIIKACQLLGLQFQPIETDGSDRMQHEALTRACEAEAPLAVVFNAGTTGCGSLDDLSSLVPVAKQFNAWCHVDAAWGGFLALLPEYHDYFKQLSQVDSVCFDPHKGLSQPRPCGLIMYQQALPLLDAETSYLGKPVEQRLPGSYGGELFLPLWLDLQSRGMLKLQQQLQYRLQQARQFADFLKQQQLWHLHSETGIVCFKLAQPVLTPLLNSAMLSTTQLNGETVYRAVFASHHTDAEALITALAPYL